MRTEVATLPGFSMKRGTASSRRTRAFTYSCQGD